MIFEHQRMMQKYFMCGMPTEEFIEVLHRDENEHKRLVRHMHDRGWSAVAWECCLVQQAWEPGRTWALPGVAWRCLALPHGLVWPGLARALETIATTTKYFWQQNNLSLYLLTKRGKEQRTHHGWIAGVGYPAVARICPTKCTCMVLF